MANKKYLLRQVVFVLHPTSVPFLVGLQIDRGRSFNINLRLHKNGDLQITEWNANLHLTVNSHVWLMLKPLNKDPDAATLCELLFKATISSSDCQTHLVFPV